MPIPQSDAAPLLVEQLQLIRKTQSLALGYLDKSLRATTFSSGMVKELAEAINLLVIGYDKILIGDILMALDNAELQIVLDLINNSNETKAKIAQLESSLSAANTALEQALADDEVDEQVKADLQARLDEALKLVADLQATNANNQAQTEQIRQAILNEQNELAGSNPTPVEPAPVEPTL